MKRILTSIIATCALLMFAAPAAAQEMTAQGPWAECIICNPDCAWVDDHNDFEYEHGLWWKGEGHSSCFWGSCVDTHQWCDGIGASAEDLERQDRINEILNTMEGDARVVALVDEFPEHVHLTISGDALEVLGAACDEGKMVGRLNVTMRQAMAVNFAKTDSRLAANF